MNMQKRMDKDCGFPKGKRGAELTIGTIVIIVLAIAILVFLIWGFSTGWTNAWGKITALIGGGTNADTIKQGCELTCTSNQKDAYCEEVKIVKKADGSKIKGSCKNLENQGISSSCPSISCDKLPVKCEDIKGGVWSEACTNKTDVTDKIGNSEGNDINKKKCCVGKTCTELGGNWQVVACVAGKLDLTSFVTDTSDKEAGKPYCCKG